MSARLWSPADMFRDSSARVPPASQAELTWKRQSLGLAQEESRMIDALGIVGTVKSGGVLLLGKGVVFLPSSFHKCSAG